MVSVTSFIIIIYDTIGNNHTLTLHWLVTSSPHEGRASQHPGIDSFAFFFFYISPVSYVWLSGDNFKDGEMNQSHPPSVVQVLISDVFLLLPSLPGQEC